MLKKFATSMAVAIAAFMAAISLTHADALDDIKKAGKIRIAIDLGVPPYGMTDDKLQPTGLDVETARLLAKDWGLEFEHVPTTGATRIPALQTCTYRKSHPAILVVRSAQGRMTDNASRAFDGARYRLVLVQRQVSVRAVVIA